MGSIDDIDRRILAELQRDAGKSLESLGEVVGLSRNACWRRIKQMEEAGILKARVALVDPVKVNLGLSVFIAVKTNEIDRVCEFHDRKTQCRKEHASLSDLT